MDTLDSLRRRIPFKTAENNDDDDSIYDEQRMFIYFWLEGLEINFTVLQSKNS